ncbi:hypothetical protein SEVIR_9G403100v4 [Setaria viridis]|uniref:Uncharacterized protein n=2 Tax=Setaria TaxID=4554 RepID=K4AEF6_SETIT|nr:uncharacterized protein LOC101775529 [Setaria italica]XP_034575191.1 uncharacterized protein LOC117839057 [Setaria viridis]RCV44754.1 hypothetical protein SETIT_9G399800v2 [Setaria italica]TKV96033.1 hypothetical protein SEVIR_9G403100v2 [Setaria viridis]
MANGGGCLLAPYFCAALLSRRGRRAARLVLWGGESRAARHGKLAGQVMLDFAGTVVCRADAFYLGRPAPVLAIEDRLLAGGTYLVLPVERLPQGYDALTAASLAALSYDRAAAAGGGPSIAGGPKSPFEYVKGDDGRTVIKVTPEFLIGAITSSRAAGADREGGGEEACAGTLCSTPELRKHYEQLVGAGRGARAWSPRLDTIKERKGRRGFAAVSPGRLSPVAVRLLSRLDGKGDR